MGRRFPPDADRRIRPHRLQFSINVSTIDKIEVALPKDTIEFNYFVKILSQCSNVAVSNDQIIQASSGNNLKPTLSFSQSTSPDPSVSFVTNTGLEKECFWVGNLPLGFNLGQTIPSSKNRANPVLATKSDSAGEYLQVKWPFATYNQLTFRQLYDRINDAVISLDHVGINISPRLLEKSKYKQLKDMIAGSSYLVDYPTAKEWPFIVPTSLEERQNKIKIGIHRDPKFEFVYGFSHPYPEIQLDFQTKLSSKDVLSLFPPPYGHYDSDPQTRPYFLSTFIYTGWGSASLRIDLRFYAPDFELTDWLLTDGKRA